MQKGVENGHLLRALRHLSARKQQQIERHNIITIGSESVYHYDIIIIVLLLLLLCLPIITRCAMIGLVTLVKLRRDAASPSL